MGGEGPRHLAMILDGNRRWAAARGLDPVDGHREGAERLFETVGWSEQAGVQTLTLWVLSADNLHRPAEEVDGLLPLIAEVVDTLAARQRWHVRHLGRIELLPQFLRESLHHADSATRYLEARMTVNMAVAYDGRREIIDAVRAVLSELMANPPQSGVPEDGWDRRLSEHLYTRGQDDPDLIIRTSGEQRLSGFMPWQAAHAEFYFCPIPWPAFTRSHFHDALRSYTTRHRRYGR
ncbi:polyprenyl diphosphate synthase [Nocardia thraciensis]